jgi:hypothetical protein
MINAIAFSKDRACQLELLLYTIKKNAPGVFNVNVIYTFSNEEFKKGYDVVKEKYPEFNFVQQTDNFKDDTLKLLNSSYEFTTFFTDDDIIYKPIKSSEEIENLIKSDEDVFCFSLRLGENVTYCYTMNCENILKNQEVIEEKFIKWNWAVHYVDFGYPLSVDGHIFRTKEILKLVRNTPFHSPNTLEGNLQTFDNFPREKMVAYKTNVLVNTPNNIVNNTHPNLNGQKFAMSAKALNDKLLSGETLEFEAMDFSNIVGCHQELEFKFKTSTLINNL